ncbi:hypothetical protein [Azospirillum sp.]|uniref:hypothetical protein n=1 Tax=Azospirillum sp. TaxID=34012 RepID=UPI002D6C4573|nr:hypothetical protein [Azospirillum sp.]HYD71451.1 hypothetical protein [Azospirillum sp.]
MDANDRTDNPRIDPTAEGGPTTPVIPGTGGAQAGGGPHVGATEGGTRGVLGIGGNPAGTPTSGLGSGGPKSGDGDSGDGDSGEEPARPAD